VRRLPALPPLTMDEHVRVCRDCGEEYRPEVQRCADCGGELRDVFPGQEGESLEAEADPAVEPALSDQDLSGYHVLYQADRATDLPPMVERLREGGLECRIGELGPSAPGAPPRFVLLVPEGESRAALAAVADLVAPPESGADVHAVEAHFDSERGYLRCPACGAEPPKGAVECPECGLGLGEGTTEEAE
jgi:Zn finger protein HypA/HybF involved in hydrogenase expression